MVDATGRFLTTSKVGSYRLRRAGARRTRPDTIWVYLTLDFAIQYFHTIDPRRFWNPHIEAFEVALNELRDNTDVGQVIINVMQAPTQRNAEADPGVIMPLGSNTVADSVPSPIQVHRVPFPFEPPRPEGDVERLPLLAEYLETVDLDSTSNVIFAYFIRPNNYDPDGHIDAQPEIGISDRDREWSRFQEHIIERFDPQVFKHETFRSLLAEVDDDPFFEGANPWIKTLTGVMIQVRSLLEAQVTA